MSPHTENQRDFRSLKCPEVVPELGSYRTSYSLTLNWNAWVLAAREVAERLKAAVLLSEKATLLSDRKIN